jgi:multiple sugar transport system substrate-binding protein
VRSKKRIVASAVAAGFAVSLALSGCSGGNNASSSEAATGEVTLASDNPQWQQGFIDMGKITSKTTGYTIKPFALPDTVSYTQSVLQALPTTKAPDIIKWWSGKLVEAVAASGGVADLTDVWDKAVAAGDLDNAIRPYYSYKGKVYAIPLGVSDSVHYYSKAAFAKAGISGVPQTFGEFQDDMAKLKAAGYTPLCLPAGDAWPVIMPYQTIAAAIDPQFYKDLTENKAKWNDPTGVKVLETISDWIKKGYTTSTDVKGADCAGLMKSGKVALINFGTWNNGGMITAGMTDADYGAFIAPSQAGPGAKNYFIEASSLMVASNAPHKKAAEATLLAWLKEDAQKVWLKTTLDLPVNPKVKTDDPVLKQVIAQQAAEKPAPLNRYYEAFPPKLVQSTIATLQAFMVTGNDPKHVADELQKQADKEWAAWAKDPAIG